MSDMNPNSGENQPQIEQIAPGGMEVNESKALEKSSVSNVENKPQQAVQITRQVANDLALPAKPISTDDTSGTDNAHLTTPATSAADSDRIEKEWIDRAKSVVAQTRDDPFEQKNAMSKVKADYIQKRFNKTVKTDDSNR